MTPDGVYKEIPWQVAFLWHKSSFLVLLHFLFYLAELYFSILVHFECFWCHSQVIFFYIVWYSPSGWCLPLSFNIEYRWRTKGAGNLLCHSLWRNNISLNHHHQGKEFTIQFLFSNHCQFWDFSKPYLSFFHHLSRKLWWMMGTQNENLIQWLMKTKFEIETWYELCVFTHIWMKTQTAWKWKPRCGELCVHTHI